MGYGVISWDIDEGAEFNILDPEALTVLLGWIDSNAVCMLVAGTPCDSHSKARIAPQWSKMPHQLRSAEHVYGLPNLNDKDRKTAEVGNRLSKATARVITACIKANVPGWEENPAGSWLWEQFGRASRSSNPSFTEFLLDQCFFGAEYRKRTKISCWLCGLKPKPNFAAPPLSSDFRTMTPICSNLTADDLRCSGKPCSFSGKRHVVLTGLSGGRFRTTSAAAYPPRLAAFLAYLPACAIWRQQAVSKWKTYCGLPARDTLDDHGSRRHDYGGDADLFKD